MIDRDMLADGLEWVIADWDFRMGDKQPTRPLADELADAVMKMLEGEKAEWEWGIARKDWPSSPAYFYRDREECERAIEHPPLGIPQPKGPWLILHRRKAGPWAKVEA